MNPTVGKIVGWIVVIALFRIGAEALVTGEFFSVSQGRGPIINPDGFGAYLMGALFIGVGALGVRGLLQR